MSDVGKENGGCILAFDMNIRKIISNQRLLTWKNNRCLNAEKLNFDINLY